jgi:Spy/CpxP family protein refolding chaperone
MKTMKIVWMSAAAALLTVASLLPAQMRNKAEGPRFGESKPPIERMLGARNAEGRWWNNPAVIEKLKLTDEQRKTMDKILLDHKATLIDLHANVEKAELAMEPLMAEDAPNETKILAAIDKIAQARAELEKANARFLLALRAKLTPEQWKTLQADRMEHHGWGQEGHRMGPEGQRPMMQGNPRMAPPAGAPQGDAPQGDVPQGVPPAAGPQSQVEEMPGMDMPPDPEPGA